MGTRNLTIVILDNEVKVAQYGQWDGYPSGQGQIIVDFILGEMNTKEFKEQLRKCQFINNAEIQKLWIECGADPNSSYVNMEIADKFNEKYPALYRDCGSHVLSLIQNGTNILQNSYEFASDSLFCEYAYVIDMDNEILEVYKGFNKKLLKETERFFSLQKEGEYFPVKLWKRYPFTELTDKTMVKLEGTDK